MSSIVYMCRASYDSALSVLLCTGGVVESGQTRYTALGNCMCSSACAVCVFPGLVECVAIFIVGLRHAEKQLPG